MRDAAPAAPPRSAAADRALARAEPPGQARRAEGPSFEDTLARSPRAEPERPATAPDRARQAERAEPGKADASKRAEAKDDAPKVEAGGEEVPAPAGESTPGAPSLSADLLAVIAAALGTGTASKAEGASATETDGADEEAATDGMTAPQPGGAIALAGAPPTTPPPVTGIPDVGTAIEPATASPPPAVATASVVDGTPSAQPAPGMPGGTAPAKADPGTMAAAQTQASPQAEAKAAPEPPSPAPPEARAEGKAETPGDASRAPERATPQGEPQAAREAPSLPPGLDALARAQGPGAQAASAAAPPAPAGPPIPVLQNVPIGAVPVEIGLKSLAGMNRFEIRLDPGDLGRIDVTLDIGETGEVKARLVVDRVETLALLQRDAKTLERAFEQAGLKASDGSVDMQLRDGGSGGRNDARGEHGRENRPGHAPGPAEGRQPPAPPPQARPIWRGTAGIDVRI